MIVFEVLMNGLVVATAGAENLSVLSHTVTAFGKLGATSQGTTTLKDSYFVDAGVTGLTSAAEEPKHTHLQWFGARIAVGDEMTIRVVERAAADTPSVVRGPAHAKGGDGDA
jgi:hypothetical protein